MTSGHMGASARFDYLEELTPKYSFTLQMLANTKNNVPFYSKLAKQIKKNYKLFDSKTR